MSLSDKLRLTGEFYAAALLECPEKSPLWRYSHAAAEFLGHAEIAPYDGGMLYPCGRCPNNLTSMAMRPEYSYTYWLDLNRLAGKVPEVREPLSRECSQVAPIDTPHTVGGAGYTHSFINYRRILADGLNGYRRRVEALPEGEFREAMTMLLDGIEVYRLRLIDELKKSENVPNKLTAALERIPEGNPRDIYEALVAWNFAFYVDGCDNIGGLERGLRPYWKGEDVTELLHELYTHVDENECWSQPLGPTYSGLTAQCIRASKNIRRPSIQLLVTEDMPDEVWEAAYESLGSSCGQPAFYNWKAYEREIHARLPEVTDEDLPYLAFGGCTETMIEGLSNVGSDDAGLNAALIFANYLRAHLADHGDFDSFLEDYAKEAEKTVAEVCGIVEEYRKTRAKYRPQPMRTLFVDDCIERITDFNAGGARYNWSVVNVAGLINVIDSMEAVKKLVYDEHRYTAEEFIEKLDGQNPLFLADCARQPKHGNDDGEVNAIANFLSGRICAEFERHACTPGGKYFPVSNQFETYEAAGMGVAATPDGRAAGEPLCDSCGAIRGRDTEGPTAMLSSVASLRGDLFLGTPITNIRISKANLPKLLRPLVEGFFAEGGMQLQVTCASREELLDALAHPEKHESLCVRIGGFSQYFNRLSPVLKQTVIERTEY